MKDCSHKTIGSHLKMGIFNVPQKKIELITGIVIGVFQFHSSLQCTLPISGIPRTCTSTNICKCDTWQYSGTLSCTMLNGNYTSKLYIYI